MKIASILAVPLVIMLSACSQTATTPTVVVTKTEQAITQPAPVDNNPAPVDNTGAYIAAIRSGTTTMSSATDAKLVETGKQVCVSLDAGNSVGSVVSVATSVASNGDEAYDLGFLIGAAVYNFCPEYYPDVQSFIQSQTS